MKNPAKIATLALFSCSLATLAQATQNPLSVDVVFSEIANHPSSILAGVPGVQINYVGPPSISPDGSHYGVHVGVDSFIFESDEYLVLDGTVLVQEGSIPSWSPGGLEISWFQPGFKVDNSGTLTFAGELQTFPSGSFDFLASINPSGTYQLEALEGTQLVGAPAGWMAQDLDGVVQTNAGIGYHSYTLGVPQGQRYMFMLDGNVFLQAGATAPGGQLTGLNEAWDVFSRHRFETTSDSLQYVVDGTIQGSNDTDDVIVRNGLVVAQEGFPLPGDDPQRIVTNRLWAWHMADNGDWMAGGGYENGQSGDIDWIALNGKEVAREGQPITADSPLIYRDLFFSATCNAVGDYLIGGRVQAPNTSNTVLVLNGNRLIAQEGDPVDLDGNGLFDDNLFYANFGSGGPVLTDDRRVLFNGEFRNAAGTNMGTFLAIIDLQEGVIASNFCDPMDPNTSGAPTQASVWRADGPGTGLRFEFRNGPPDQFGYLLVGTASLDPGITLGNGRLCLNIGAGNQIGRYNIAGTNRSSIGQFDSAGVFQNLAGTSSNGTGFDLPSTLPLLGSPSITAGQTWYFQAWHRDQGTTTNFSNGVAVTF